jgi:23S rRNA pseudouridine2605 synthase
VKPASTERLQKAISAAGLMSRRAAEELIADGRVTVNGRVAKLGDRANVAVDRIEVDGVLLPLAPNRVTYLLNKPLGVISTAADPGGRQTVIDLVPPEPRVVPVGRLDADSEGLLLISNDGDLINAVTHPRFGVTKTYLIEVIGVPATRVMRQLREGVLLDDGIARVIKARLVASTKERAQLEVVMGEGRNREVRRLLEAVGHPVEKLVRVAIGPLRDVNLRPGAWRRLSNQEVRTLYQAAGQLEDSVVS